MFCSIHDFNFLIDRRKNLRTSLSWDFRKKETFARATFGKIYYVASAINRAGKLICLRACLHDRDRAGLIDKPDKYITTPEFNALAANVFNARLAQANLITKTDFDVKLSSLNRKITANRTKNLLVENEFKS